MKIGLLLLSFCLAFSAISQKDTAIVLPVDVGDPLLFSTGDRLRLEIHGNRSRIQIVSDLLPAAGRQGMVHYTGVRAVETVQAGSFRTTGLQLVQCAFSRRNDEYRNRHRDSVAPWIVNGDTLNPSITNGYPYFTVEGGNYIGSYWTVGAEQVLTAVEQFYLYSYAAGNRKDLVPANSFLKTIYTTDFKTSPSPPACPSLVCFSDSLTMALERADQAILQEKLKAVYQDLVTSLDSGKICRFVFYMPRTDPFRLLVIQDSALERNSLELCKSFLKGLIPILRDTAVSLLTRPNTKGKAEKVPLITQELATALLEVIDGSLFTEAPDWLFTMVDENNAEATLHLLASDYQLGTDAIYAGVIAKAVSTQLVVVVRLTGKGKGKTL